MVAFVFCLFGLIDVVFVCWLLLFYVVITLFCFLGMFACVCWNVVGLVSFGLMDCVLLAWVCWFWLFACVCVCLLVVLVVSYCVDLIVI